MSEKVVRLPSCAAVSRSLGEPVHGFAPLRRRLLLVEHREPWGVDALGEAAASEPALARVRQVVEPLGVRMQLIRRRPRRGLRFPAARRVLVAGTDGPDPFVEQIEFGHLDELGGLDWDRLAADGPPGLGDAVDDRLYLTCAHGRHDACCARQGTVVSRVVEDLVGDRAWQTSHVGGCRFAATMVLLPHGYYLGHLDARSAAEAVRAYERGEVDARHLRGRAGQGAAADAAEALVRRRHGIADTEGVVVEGVDRPAADDADAQVLLRTPDGSRWRATVRQVEHPEPRHTTCGASEPSRVARWDLVDLTATDAEALA